LEDMVRLMREGFIALESAVVEHKDRVRVQRHEAQAKRVGAKPLEIKEEDLVLVSTEASVEGVGDKLTPRWVGPFQVVKQISPLTLEVRQLGSERTMVVHTQRVQRFDGPELYRSNPEELIHVADLSLRGKYLAEKILSIVQEGPASYKFKVRWFGYESKDDTFEPVSRLHADVPKLVEEFLDRSDLPERIAAMVPEVRKLLHQRVTRAAARGPRRRYTRF